MAFDKSAFFEGPIPGANYTSDTKNYPWHRPPEVTDTDEAIEWCFKKITAEESLPKLLTAFQMGLTVVQATDVFTIKAIGKGKFTIDTAVLIAGPVAHIMYLLAKGYGIDVDLGIDKKNKYKTKSYYKAEGEFKKIDEDKAQAVVDKIDLVKIQEAAARIEQNQPAQPSSGFAGMAEPQEQESPQEEEAEI